jgi:HlyD family secretion protein
VHTIGGVIQGDGTPIMLIVPENGDLTVEARVRPLDIDQIHVGAEATLRLSAFNRRTTPEIFGTVNRISTDTSHDPRSGESYYTIRVAIPPAEISRLDDLHLMPGMPVEAFVQTGDRSVMSYLVKPAADQIQRAFRDE